MLAQFYQLMVLVCLLSANVTALAKTGTPNAHHTKPLLVLDSGHTPERAGALGARGVYEQVYNDRFCAELALALKAAGWQVVLTRKPAQSISLTERARLANSKNAALFLSIHHDSAQLKYLKQKQLGSKTAWHSIKPIRGYSLFVAKVNPKYEQSLVFANLLSDELQKVKRKPTLHHAEKIAGENRTLIDATKGIYQFDELVVLNKTKVPAVLFEVGVIVDDVDEAYVSDADNRKKIIAAIVVAASKFASSDLANDDLAKADTN